MTHKILTTTEKYYSFYQCTDVSKDICLWIKTPLTLITKAEKLGSYLFPKEKMQQNK